MLLVLLNAILKPLIKVLTLPVQILTLGLFSFVIAWFMLWLTSWITDKLDFATLTVGGFWKTLLAAVVIALVTACSRRSSPEPRRRTRAAPRLPVADGFP